MHIGLRQREDLMLIRDIHSGMIDCCGNSTVDEVTERGDWAEGTGRRTSAVIGLGGRSVISRRVRSSLSVLGVLGEALGVTMRLMIGDIMSVGCHARARLGVIRRSTPLALDLVIQGVETHLVIGVLFPIVPRLGLAVRGMLVGMGEVSEAGRNARLRAITFNGRRVARVGQPIRKTLILVRGMAGIVLFPDATGSVTAGRGKGGRPLLTGPKRGEVPRRRAGKRERQFV